MDSISVLVADWTTFFSGSQEARKAQLENHEPEDEEEDIDMDKDAQDSGQSTFFLNCCSAYYASFPLFFFYTNVSSKSVCS